VALLPPNKSEYWVLSWEGLDDWISSIEPYVFDSAGVVSIAVFDFGALANIPARSRATRCGGQRSAMELQF
jgi:hypothetical protein